MSTETPVTTVMYVNCTHSAISRDSAPAGLPTSVLQVPPTWKSRRTATAAALARWLRSLATGVGQKLGACREAENVEVGLRYVENSAAAAPAAVASFQAAVIPLRHIYILAVLAGGSRWLEAARSVGDDRANSLPHQAPQQAQLTPINSELLNGQSTRTGNIVNK